ncbi:MAG: DNA/RNA non-specific endonuclease [Barnesiella sp.]|nr:DNA/RNA non-specific endonuclease [Barnesiella sp.]
MAKRNRKNRFMTSRASQRRSRSSMRSAVVMLIVVAAIFVGARYLLAQNRHGEGHQEYGELTYVKSAPGLSEEIINYKGMTVSFNPDLHIPNWVAWELTAEEAAGTESRADKFYNDPEVKGCPYPEDYRNSGYDRGHMAPAGDMKWDKRAMEETFCLTNILPQDGSLNRGTWKNIEEKCRARAARDSAVIIVCGPVLTEAPREYIGNSRVAVPQRLFKVILSPWAETPQAIGFLMDNGPVKGGMQAVAVTVDEIEALTGHDFFSALPDSLENALESKVNFTRWSRLK